MRYVVICGDRGWPARKASIIADRIAEIPRDVVVVEGGQRGVDLLAADACRAQARPFLEVPADWSRYDKTAGPIRNRWMLDLGPEAVIAFHDYIWGSKGTKDCVNEALGRSIPVQLIDKAGERQTVRYPFD